MTITPEITIERQIAWMDDKALSACSNDRDVDIFSAIRATLVAAQTRLLPDYDKQYSVIVEESGRIACSGGAKIWNACFKDLHDYSYKTPEAYGNTLVEAVNAAIAKIPKVPT